MRKLLLAAVLGILTSVTSGCVIPGYSGDPTVRVQELIHTSENQRLVLDEWQRMWHLDQPDHCTPYRTHGGII